MLKKTRLEDKFTIAKNIAIAIDALHKAGLIHRDIKLENIMVLPDFSIKLIDYGFTCKIGSGSEVCKGRMGTEGYTDPSVVLGDIESLKKADWWAFGQVLFSFYTNKSLYDSRTRRYVALTAPDRALISDKKIDDLLSKMYVLQQSQRLTAAEILQTFL
jgi:serine/threonine protein kinase